MRGQSVRASGRGATPFPPATGGARLRRHTTCGPKRTVLKDFTSLGLSAPIVARLTRLGFTAPTPIQAQAIPHALDGRDVLGLAQTGTGKTAAFGLPLITGLIETGQKPAPHTARALVLAPTRELAKQISETLAALSEGTKLTTTLVVGGAAIGPQRKKLARGTDLLIATPGRLIDHLDNRAVRLDATPFLVLDEADHMLDMGFIHALRRIARALTGPRQTMLFSATMPKQMEEIAQSFLSDPVRVQVSPPGKAADKVTQALHFVAQAEKADLLIELLDAHRDERALVFGRTKHGSEKLMKKLVAAGFAAASIHGNKSQGQRDRALAAFRAGDIKVLVATDVAARGLDIPEVRHVYNFDLPNVPDNYVHRIGRTARAGADGAAIAFCAPAEMGELKAIQKVMGTTIPVVGGTPWEAIDAPAPKKPQHRRRGGGGGGTPAGGAKPGKPRRNRRPRRGKQQQAA